MGAGLSLRLFIVVYSHPSYFYLFYEYPKGNTIGFVILTSETKKMKKLSRQIAGEIWNILETVVKNDPRDK